MSKTKFNLFLMLLLVFLSACDKKGASSVDAATPSVATNEKMIDFVTTQDGKPLVIDAALFNTPAAKEFMTTGKNSYVGNEEAIAKGKKIFQMYSCTQCHGPEAKGQVGPGLTGPDFRYPKDATNKGMFETVWHGTNGGMGAKGIGLMDPTDPKNGITPDELLKVISWVRSLSKITGNE
ncbi:cytochrome c-L precursor [mine drainage metagenome]|uniref:Cytochrome c-L n=1 Tax=mine drainage metagenome TaxID=410659 RepID=A0A1J5SKC1_9ZZZZ